jgi:hypothetical protein
VTVPEQSLSQRNIRLSVQRFLKGGWTDPRGILAGWSDAGFDPDARSGEGEPADLWAAFEWLTGGAGNKSYTLLQVDLLSRTGTDPVGSNLTRELDALTGLLRATRTIPLYDFSAVLVESDVETVVEGNNLLIQAPGGRVGALMSSAGPTLDAGNWRITVTVAFRLLSDVARADYYP